MKREKGIGDQGSGTGFFVRNLCVNSLRNACKQQSPFPIPHSILPILLFVFLSTVSLFSQEPPEPAPSVFWISPGAEIALYGKTGPAYGGGLSLGYGSGSSMGIKTAYLYSTEGFTILEFNFLIRWYFMGRTSDAGPFIQFGCGPVFITEGNNPFGTTASTASISAGLNIGWRVLLGSRFFLEPSVRAGYPFFAGAGLSAGFHFDNISFSRR